MIELGSPGRRCLLRAMIGYQRTPRADYRNFGADSLGDGDLSLRYISLINLSSIQVNLLIFFRFFNTNKT
jgi:hypothetical protein